MIRTRTCAYQEVRNVNFSKNFAYLLMMPLNALKFLALQSCVKSFWKNFEGSAKLREKLLGPEFLLLEIFYESLEWLDEL